MTLAHFRNPACKSSEETIAKALSGDWKDEYVFVLKQSFELYDFYSQQLDACDAQIQQQFSTVKPRWDGDPQSVPVAPLRSKKKKHSTLNIRAEVIRLTGVDLGAVVGLSDTLIQTILAEIGTDMNRWPTEKHFASWLGLAPHNDISGGKVLRSRTLPTNNRAGQAFRQAAPSIDVNGRVVDLRWLRSPLHTKSPEPFMRS
ncbi:MAG: transposase [Chloroflexota bacterium]